MRSLCAFCRRIRITAAACLLFTHLAVHGQAPYPVPIAPSPALTVLAVLVEAALLWSLFPKDDQKQVRELERRHDWEGLAALADRSLRALGGPDAPRSAAPGAEGGSAEEAPALRRRADQRAFWLLVRAHAKRRLGDCAGSIDDHQAATLSGAKPPVAAELERGQCEMSLARWEDAQRTMLRAAQAEPALWEPHFNLAVIRSVRGDAAGARDALASLRARNPAAADAFEAGFGAAFAGAAGPPAGDGAQPAQPRPGLRDLPVVGPGLLPSTPAGWLAAGEMAFGGRALRLPPGAWLLASASASSIIGRVSGNWSGSQLQARGIAVPTLAGIALSVAGGRVDSIVVYEANPRLADNVDDWNAAACRPTDAIFVDRFAARFDGPECLSLHRVGAPEIAARAEFAALAELVRTQGLALHPVYYASAYAGYGVSAMARVTVYRPVAGLPGDLVAIDWARLLADTVRPLAEGRAAVVALPW